MASQFDLFRDPPGPGLSESHARSDLADDILIVGEWQAFRYDHPDFRGARVERCAADAGSLRSELALHRPVWLVVGQVHDESIAQLLVTTAWQMYPDLRLAMLGPLHDLRRCERWLRRGCHVYLAYATRFATMLTALECAVAADLTVVDRAFYLRRIELRHVGAVPSLTARQQEVLGQLGRNLTNSEIALTLNVSENTVEFHIRRLLVKLGARNRMQAVARAQDLGLL